MKYFVLAILLSTMLVSTAFTQTRAVEISGRVVDGDGNAAKNVQISWRYEPEEIIEGGRTVGVYSTMEDGYFEFQLPWKSGKKVRIYFEAPIVVGRFSPLGASQQGAFVNRNIPNILISKFSPAVRLGEISSIAKFGVVRILISEADRKLIRHIKGRLVYLRVQDSLGRIVVEETVNTAFSEENQWLEICVPVGKWNLTIYDAGSSSQVDQFLVDVKADRLYVLKMFANH